MTPFAQLEADPRLEKVAAAPTVLRGAHNLMRNGFWRTASRKYGPEATGWRGGLGRASRLFHNPNAGKMGDDGLLRGKTTLLSKGLIGYGIGGTGAEMMGYDVPGSMLALNAVWPGVGALFSAPPAISSARLMLPGNKAKVMEDAKTGAREAVGDMMSLAQSDPRYASHADLYRQFMSQYSPESSQLSSQYSTGAVKPLGRWGTISSAFSDPQKIVNDRLDRRVPGLLDKVASHEKSAMTALRAFGRGAGHVLPWLPPVAGLGMLGHAALREKPYDAAQAQQRGYAGTQAAMQEKLKNLNGIERMALRLDPSLIGQQAEKFLPGTIAQWEQRSGQKHQPGFISNVVDNWSKGGNSSYYEYDAEGKRHYLKNP